MSELNEMGCREFSDAAAELALGVLTGRERAQALAHLDHCASCRENVRQLTATGEGLLGLLPSVEPPAGFEARVMDRLGLAAPAPSPSPSPASWISRTSRLGRKPARRAATGQARPARRTQRVLALAAVALAVVAAGLGGWGLRSGTSAPAGTPLSSATLLSASHQAAGKIFLYESSARWLYMSVDMPAGNGTVICEVQSRDDHITTVGSFRLTHGHGYWGSPVPATQGPLTGARLVAPGGTVLATATFHSA
ncbi:MAG: zf-HC2 domain-containing protein [Streptosporangiaceae bacterium]